MEFKSVQAVDTEVLVIGGGGAGLRAAIEAKKYDIDVLLVSKSRVAYGNNTAIAEAIFAATGIWKGTNDSPEMYFKDIITGGRFINDRRLVRVMTSGTTQQVYDLIKFGVSLEKQDGDLLVDHAPGHTYPRHVAGDGHIGISLTKPMRDYAADMGVRFQEGILITKLLKAEDMVVGALGIDDKGQAFVFTAKATILATGGAGELYLRNTNAAGSTGDGYALAYQLGLPLRDMEFVQFYPTALGRYGKRVWPYGGFLRGGATFRNSLGEDILERHGIKDFALETRDAVSRAMTIEIAEGRDIEGNLIADLTGLDEKRRERYHRLFQKRNYPEKALVAPAVHFFMGGVNINESCETGLSGLYAAGEVCGGMHGANRLGGNALTEVWVFGKIAGANAAARASKMKRVPAPQSEVSTELERLKEFASYRGKEELGNLQVLLKQTMWHNVGVLRNKRGLEDALREILSAREQLKSVSLQSYSQLSKAIKLANMLTVSEMVCRAALKRTESRGAHYRTDYPEENNEQWLKNIEISDKSGHMTLRVTPIKGNGGRKALL